MAWRSPLLPLLGAALLVALCGCGGKGHPDLYPVTGKVTYRDQAVRGAQVMFMAAEASSGKTPAAHGETDAEGRFTLMTFHSGDGATAGQYKVLITKGEEVPDPKQPNSPYKITRDLLPARYGNAKQSDLKAEVKPGEPNDFPFNLTD